MKKQVIKAASALEKDVFSEVAKDGAHYREIHRKYVEASLDPNRSEAAEQCAEAMRERENDIFRKILSVVLCAAGIALGWKQFSKP